MSNTDRWRFGFDLLSTVALVATCALLVWQRIPLNPRAAQSLGVEAASPVEPITLTISLVGVTEGAPSARLALVEFADIECPFCRQFARDTYPQLKRDFIDAGQLRYALRHFPLDAIHMKARRASAALECAGEQHQYWTMYTRLFQEPQQIGETQLIQHVRALGLNESQFTGCLENEPAAIKRDLEEAGRLKVRSTPTFFVGRVQPNGTLAAVTRIQGVMPYEALKSVLKEISD